MAVIRAHIYSTMIEARRDKQYPAAIAAGKVLLDYAFDGDPLERGAPVPKLPAAERQVIEATFEEAGEPVPATDADRLDALIQDTQTQLQRASGDSRRFNATANTLRRLIETRARLGTQAATDAPTDDGTTTDAVLSARLDALCAPDPEAPPTEPPTDPEAS